MKDESGVSARCASDKNGSAAAVGNKSDGAGSAAPTRGESAWRMGNEIRGAATRAAARLPREAGVESTRGARATGAASRSTRYPRTIKTQFKQGTLDLNFKQNSH